MQSRALPLLIVLLALPLTAASQETGVLRISVVLADAAGTATPLPRVLLLVSDNPASGEPRRLRTTGDGVVEVKLPPGNYTVESDRPIAFAGKAYLWMQTVDVAAGRDTVLQLTAGNAEIGPITADAATVSSAPVNADAATVLAAWRDTVVEVWSPTMHASGFLIDAKGLIATNQRAIGGAASVEVQVAPSVKVAGSVLASDPAADVAILWIDPQVMAAVRPLPIDCAATAKPGLQNEQEIVTIAAPLFDAKGMTAGTVRRVEARAILANLRPGRASSGGPVLTRDGRLIGITASDVDSVRGGRDESRVIPIDLACGVVAAAEKKLAGAAPPPAAHLPIEPPPPPAIMPLADPTPRPVISPSQFQFSSSDFDIALLTPMLVRGSRYPLNARTDFANWSDYVSGAPPVLLVRVTPQFEEGFWTTVARGAAQSQGVPLPPLRRFTSSLLRLRAYCGDAEVTPIHPFTIERSLSEKHTIREGLYVFALDAFGPHCGTIKFEFFSEKAPAKADTKVVDPSLFQLVRDAR